ncbi:MAG: TonB-dependent receptor [Acidimicrobiales bacterium]|nr:TonB-dependent receptor [Hyphomonadaceae bacterium]RZV43543.1 MAG: TonB-dependent receptor [Acidimicrobiales bacterium]
MTRNTTTNLKLCLAATVGIGALSASPVFAQSGDEIIVTATRRAESIQDVPIAVTAVLPEDLEKQGVVNIQNLGSVAPSFATSNAQIASGSVVLRVRGVGTTSNNIGFESAVGIFIDGAYQSRPGIALSEFVDVERVEVLRGPQGTLFGRNTSAGALNITNVRPDLDEAGGFINATYGNFDHKSIQAAVNIPLAEGKVAARLTGALRDRDGYVDIIDRNGAKIGESNSVDQFYLRGQIGFEGESNWKGRVVVDYAESDSICCSALEVLRSPVEAGGVFGLVGLGARGGMAAPNVATSATDFDGAQAAVDDRIATSSQVPNPTSDQFGVVAEVEYALGDSADIIYIGSYREYDATEVYDSAFSGLDLFNVGPSDGTPLSPGGTSINTMTQELRVQGDAMDGKLSWLVGGYYADEEILQTVNFGLGTDYSRFVDALLIAGTGGAYPNAAILGLGGSLPVASGGQNPADARTSNRYSQDSKSWSIFTHNTFDVTDQLSLTVGLRYSDESKDGSFSQPTASYPSCEAQLANFNGTFPPAPAALNGNLVVLGCFPFLAPADHPLAAVLPLPRSFDTTFEDDELIYTGKLGYEVNPDISTYASFTHGYKSGGFNLDSTAAIGGADPRFASETVDAYELGFKSKLLDNKLTLNVAAFLEQFENFQVLEFTGARFETFNVPKAETKGVEIETVVRPTDNITLNGGLTLLSAEYPDDCAGTQTKINVTSLCGNTLTNAPKTVGIFGATYDGEFGENYTFFLNGSVRYESDRRTSTQAVVLATQTPNPFDIQEANTKINLRAGIGNADGDWSLEAWATNLTNVITRGVTINTTLRSGSRSAFIQDPRMYGVTVRRNF